jgi:cytochrome c oxidase subunit 4
MSGHHISSAKLLFGIAGALLILTILTVAVYYVEIPHPWGIIAAMGVATLKATLVALFFMNLYWDEKFNSMVFLTSIVFFALLVGLTLLDTLYRVELIPSF